MNPILENYFAVADTIAATFGKKCEVVVHDLSHPEDSVVYVANGIVTGRKIGQPFDHLVKKVLLNKNFKEDQVNNYTFTTPDGKKIKSSSVLIRDINHDVIGMLCINYDITIRQQLQAELNDFLCTSAIEDETVEDVDQNVMEIINKLIASIIGNVDVKNISRNKCVEIVRFMDDKGIFLVKGAIDKVAALMGVSKVTVYSYLDEAKGKR